MILVVDVGTTSLRAAIVDPVSGQLAHLAARTAPPDTPFPGLVEFDAAAMATAVLDLATEVLGRADAPVTGVGITCQRASTVVWDRTTGEPIGPGIGWQDLRTVGECLVARAEHGLELAPNQTATKAAWLLDHVPGARDRDLCIGTVDAWIAWVLSRGELHVTDHTNAAVTGLYDIGAAAWHVGVAETLRIPVAALPRLVDTAGPIGEATALPGSPPILALVGDQQASLVGLGCVRPGLAKVTFGTGGMLDVCAGDTAPVSARRAEHGTFPIVAWSRDGARTWGAEAIMLSAGSNVEWLCDDLGLVAAPADTHELAASVPDSDGVVFVPAPLGLGTPHWDYGARGTLLGLTRGSTAAHVVRAVLEGVAHRGADLVDAAEADTGLRIPTLRIDGGMSTNPTFVQALADASGRPVEVSPVVEATTVGAAKLAGLGTGALADTAEVAATFVPATVVEPGPASDPERRRRWQEAVRRSRGWIPELSALDF
jgi:glycerol kinase